MQTVKLKILGSGLLSLPVPMVILPLTDGSPLVERNASIIMSKFTIGGFPVTRMSLPLVGGTQSTPPEKAKPVLLNTA